MTTHTLGQLLNPIAQCIAIYFLGFTLAGVRKCLLRIFQLRHGVDPHFLLIKVACILALETELRLSNSGIRTFYVERAVIVGRLIRNSRFLEQVLLVGSFLYERALGRAIFASPRLL